MWCRLALLVAVTGLAAADFSGSWTLSVKKSDFGPAPPPQSLSMTVRHSGDQVAVNSSLVDQRGPSTSSYTLDLSGKETENVLRGNRIVSVSSRRGEGLHVKARTTVQNVEIKTVDQWMLEDGGRQLTIYRTATTPKGDLEQKFVYIKDLGKP